VCQIPRQDNSMYDKNSIKKDKRELVF